ncbi:TPA: hypothetical protein ACKQBZ_004523 [Stenotrophomonas maltophilia]
MDFLANERPSAELVEAMEVLWRLPDAALRDLTRNPAYLRLLDAISPHCSEVRKFFGEISMSRALAGLGLPCGLPASKKHLAIPARDAAERLQAALKATSYTRFHLMPLDLAGRIPTAHFGNAMVGRLSSEQLSRFADYDRMHRFYAEVSFDLYEFSQFHWLVVKEEVPILHGSGGRQLYQMPFDLSEDFGCIEPHQGKYPEAVETALFWLALAPWELWVDAPHIEWRGMQIPWVYSVDHDLFSAMKRPPSSDTLTWEDRVLYEDDGRPVDLSQPVSMWVSDEVEEGLVKHFEDRIVAIAEFAQLQLFQTPVAHFFTRAYLANGIDEFMGHLLAIEAALGLPGDYKRKSSSGLATHRRYYATDRMCGRLVAMLDLAAASDYRELFELRSQFLHGRSMQAIPAAVRLRARTLARRVVDGLVLASQAGQTLGRGTFLDNLLDQGVPLLQPQTQGA